MTNVMDILYCTGIYLAAQNGHRDIVKYLSEEMNYEPSEDVYKFSTFYLAAQNGLLDVVKQFMNESISFLNIMQVKSEKLFINNIFDNFLNIHSKDKDGNTCVHHAVLEGNEMFLNHLIKEGANLQATNFNNDQPIHLAARNGFNHIIKILVKNGANLNIFNKSNDTPLHYAVLNKHSIVVKELLKCRAKNLRNNYGYLPIHYSSNKEINNLLKQDGDDDYKDAADNTLLHIAALNGHYKIINKLIESNVNIDDKNKDGDTALHLATQHGFTKIIKILLKDGATYNIENKKYKTPLNLSKDQNVTDLLQLIEELFKDAKNGNVEIISKLEVVKLDEFVAMTNARNNQGHTLLQVAIINKHKNIASKLLDIIMPDQIQSCSSSKCELETLKKPVSIEDVKKAAEVHIEFSNLYLPMLRNMSICYDSEYNILPWKTLKEGSYYLGNAYSLVQKYKKYTLGKIDDENIKLIHSTLVALEFDRKHISSGYTDEAYGGTAICFVSKGQGTAYYNMLHSRSKKDVRLFIEMVERNIDAPVKKFLKSSK